jgi:hypothetical protein
MLEPASVPPAVVDFDDASGDIKYWEVIERVKGWIINSQVVCEQCGTNRKLRAFQNVRLWVVGF